MKKIIVTTRQTILQDWEYKIEVPDNFNITACHDIERELINDRIFNYIHKVVGGGLSVPRIADEEILEVCDEQGVSK